MCDKKWTAEEMRQAGFGKIHQDTSGNFITAQFYNPATKEHLSECVRDYDYEDCSRDNAELYHMPIDTEVLRQWNIDNGIIFVGAVVEVFKGRKVPVGTIATVEEIKPWHDRYGRWQCNYAYLSNGMRTNTNNCRFAS